MRHRRPSSFVLAFAACGLVLVAAAPAFAQANCSVDPKRELFITDLSVVNDCTRTTWGPCPGDPGSANAVGAWTFGRLVQGIAGSTDPNVLSKFVLDWLDHWERDLTINKDDVPARGTISDLVTDPWLQASGGTRLDMKKAPFRLLAIVARLDLRKPPIQDPMTAGEGRFVFGVLNPSNPDGPTLQFNVIMEYNLRADSCDGIRDWGKRWHNLGTIPFGPSYNVALQAVTDSFTRIGADPARLNGSALNQLRTNEVALAFPWELREFKLVPGPTLVAPLVETTVAQNPDFDLIAQRPQLIADFINEFTPQILNGTYVVPLSYQGSHFLGGASPNDLITPWDGPPPPCSAINVPEARHLFSLGTCNACHGVEADIVFKHVEPRPRLEASQLSAFVTGGPTGTHTVTDSCGLVHDFNELKRRSTDLCKLLSSSCAALAEETPTSRVH